MAKEQWHNWGRTVVTIVTLVFVCGITYKTIEGNTDDIKENTDDIKVVRKDIHNLQLWGKDMEGIASSSDKSLKSIDNKLDGIGTRQQSIETDMAVMKVKVETLTKD